MTEEITLEEYKKAYFEVYKEQRRKSFFMHLAIYILVNTVSSVINFIFTQRSLGPIGLQPQKLNPDGSFSPLEKWKAEQSARSA